ncbi:MAG TPA: cupin domain-containing protein [Longimicrobiales bacterium]|nr:cupin domain-containing protein [Longimicrobiales bacterium]
MRVYTIVLILLAALQARTSAQDAASHSAAAVIALSGELRWGPAPAILPAGAELAVIEGDPTKAGEFTMRLRMPAGYRIPPHWHPATEHVTVVKGSFFVGMGQRFDRALGKKLPVGAFGALPAGMRHFAWTEEETIIQLHGNGPWSLTYVDSQDDPRSKTGH